jgi:uncharacterized lipoprotein YmbA
MKIPILSLFYLIILSGCASTPDQFYRLTPDGALPASSSRNALSIGIGPIKLPEYLDRDELVFQSATYRFEIPAEHRWAGSLDKSIASVLATNLGHRLGTSAVQTYPSLSDEKPRYTVPVTIRQFHAVSGGDAILEANWEISGGANKRGSRTFTEPLREEGYDGMIAAESRLLGQLADAIAAMIGGS